MSRESAFVILSEALLLSKRLLFVNSDKHSPVNALVGHQASAPLLTDQDSHQQSGKVHCSSWDRWNLPAFITNVATGLSQHIKSSALVRLLVLRFFTSPSANLIIVPPREDLVSSLQAGRLEVIPDYLLQTIVACTAASEDTQEPELRLWRLQIWHSATEAAHARLGSRERPRLELIQALLLLSCNWPGPLARIERLNTFDSAINLATTMQLHNSRQPDGKNSSLRSQRQALFWALYCFDKVLSITSGRQPSIPWESHDIPLPTMEMIEELSILDQADCVWVHRLALAFVSLCRLIEDIHASLHTAHTFGWMTSMEHLLLHIRPLEARLEDFCKCQKWLLSADMSGLAPACKELTDAVVSQLHLAQLQLYLPALQFEARKNGASTGHPISFSPESAKSLAATVESAWHLVQQAPHQLQLHSAGLDAAGGATTHTGDGAMSFARACSMQGLEAFNFLGFAWKNWEGGRGCVALMPSHPVQPQHIGADHEHEQSDQNSEAQTHCTSNPASLAAAHYAFGTPQVNVAHHQPVNDLGASNHHAWQPPAGVGHQERGPAVSLRQQSGVQRGYADVQSGSMQNGSQSRRPGAPQPLTLSGVHRASTSPDDLSLRSPANELIVPEHIGRNGSSAPASKCDTAAMANMLLSTPARLLFHGTEEVPPSSGGACIGNPSPPSNKMSHITSAAGALKSRAMLTPIDTTFIEAVRQAAVEEVSSDEGGPTFPGIYEGRLESQRTGQTCRGAADINDRLSLPDSSAAMMQGRDDTTMEPHAEFHYRGSIVPAETRLNMQPMIAEAHPVPHGDADGSTSRTHNVPATDALDTQLASLDEHGSIDLDTSVDDAGSSYLANAVSLLRSTIRSL